jgi:lysophospholipase L1-like esterase
MKTLKVCLAGFLLVVSSVALSQVQLPNPERFEAEISAFERQDLEKPPPENAIVLLGSSSFRLWNNASEALAPLTVINRGFGGSTMFEALELADRIAINYKPRAILIYEGDNDTGMVEPLPQEMILDHLDQLVNKIHAALPETRIYILAIKPSILRDHIWPVALEVNEAYRDYAETDERLYYIDIATPLLQADGTVMRDIFVPDNLHLNEKGYEIWGQAVREALNPVELQYE